MNKSCNWCCWPYCSCCKWNWWTEIVLLCMELVNGCYWSYWPYWPCFKHFVEYSNLELTVSEILSRVVLCDSGLRYSHISLVITLYFIQWFIIIHLLGFWKFWGFRSLRSWVRTAFIIFPVLYLIQTPYMLSVALAMGKFTSYSFQNSRKRKAGANLIRRGGATNLSTEGSQISRWKPVEKCWSLVSWC